MSLKNIVSNMSKESSSTAEQVQRSLKKRYRAEKRFRLYGIVSIFIGMLALLLLFGEIIRKGIGAFEQHYIQLEVTFDEDKLGFGPSELAVIKKFQRLADFSSDEREAIREEFESVLTFANFTAVARGGLLERFPHVSSRGDKRDLYALISNGASYRLRDMLADDLSLLNTTHTLWLLADDDLDTYVKSLGDKEPFIGRLNEKQIGWISELLDSGEIDGKFNTIFFTSGDSSEPEQAGILGAVMGTFFTLIVTLLLSFPVGVAAAVYLEEYAKKNRFTDFIEVNINNLAAVPSVIFGLLGLAVFLNMFGMTRSIPLVGGMVLTLMTLPTIIISSRAAITSVPPSIREAALGMGASRMQMILHHVLPLAMPGMLTGAIIGMARALGETAPLLMIGMVAFIVEIPSSWNDAATVLPVQIFLWADSPERAFVERTSAAIMVLLAFLIMMNGLAIYLRKRLERRW